LDALDRLTPEHLERVEEDLLRIRASLSTSKPKGVTDAKAVIHCHSHLSHDSEGSIQEMARAARETGTKVVMMTDHPRKDIDVLTEGFQGRESGVLFIPGAEARNLLLFFSNSPLDYSKNQRELLLQARRRDAMAFLSHLEEQEDWSLSGLDGSEIYNLHASFKMQPRLSRLFRPRTPEDFELLLSKLFLINEHPDAGIASLCETPDLYLSAWDRLLKTSRLTGIAANDSHANNTLRLRAARGGRIQVRDFRNDLVAELPPGVRIPGDLPGRKGLTLSPDSYRASFAHVGTHLLTRDLTITGVKESLSKGRCYVAFDWIAEPYGFSFRWEGGRESGDMGSVAPMSEHPVLLSRLPAEAWLTLRRDGEKVEELRSRELEYRPEASGVYRLEAYLDIAGERRPWIISNPIYAE